MVPICPWTGCHIPGANVTEREWREASDMRKSTLSLAAILAVAAILRFHGLGTGIPFAVSVDEPEIVDRAVAMMRTGDFNPRFYDYPGLYIYLQLAVSVVRFIAGAIGGEWQSLNQVTSADFFVWGRGLTAAIGTVTVLLVYLAGLRWGTRTALLAAGFMAVIPLHVRESHFVLTDVPVTAFVALTLVLSLRAHEQPRAAAFALAGVAAGLGAATKYPGLLALSLPLVAVWMTPAARPSRIAGALAALGAAAAAFLVASPYTVLDLPGFLDGFGRLMGSYTGAEPPQAPWLTYAKHLRNAVQWPAFILVLAGVVLAMVRAVRGTGRVRWALAGTFPVLYFWFVSQQSLVYARYLLPVMPFVCLLAAAAVVSGVSLLRRFSIPRKLRTALIVALTVALLLPATVASISFNQRIARQGTLAQAYQWIGANVSPGSMVVIESSALVLRYSPYRSRNVPQLRLGTYAHYVETGADYLVASSQCYGPYMTSPHLFPDEYAEYMRIFEQSETVATFPATADHPGPELRILKVRR
jgi:4-amino-4-deoxy-L-arabinose transferase-like glycosyltransferase